MSRMYIFSDVYFFRMYSNFLGCKVSWMSVFSEISRMESFRMSIFSEISRMESFRMSIFSDVYTVHVLDLQYFSDLLLVSFSRIFFSYLFLGWQFLVSMHYTCLGYTNFSEVLLVKKSTHPRRVKMHRSKTYEHI